MSTMGGQARLPGAVVGVIGRMLDDSDQHRRACQHPDCAHPTAIPDTLCAHHRRLAAWRTLLDAKATHG